MSRFVYAGSNHAVGRTPRTDLLTVDHRPRPDTFYGVGKVAAEALMSLYADRYGLDAVSCRIGCFLAEPRPPGTCPPGSATTTAYAWSRPRSRRLPPASPSSTASRANTRAWWDLEPGRALGYEPQDDAEDFADRIAAAPRGRGRGRARRRPVRHRDLLPPGARPFLSPGGQPPHARLEHPVVVPDQQRPGKERRSSNGRGRPPRPAR